MKKLLMIAMLLVPQLALAQTHYVRGVLVKVPPPAPRYETPPPAPSPRHQWIAGYWADRGGRQEWITGRWALPPQMGYAWEPARWETVNGQQMFYDGHWRNAEQVDPAYAYQPPPPPVQQVVTEVAPPPPIEEVRTVSPFAGAVWVPGYWHWADGRHVWVGGRWSAQPAGYHWEEHKWERREDNHWVQRPGRWDHH